MELQMELQIVELESVTLFDRGNNGEGFAGCCCCCCCYGGGGDMM